MYKGLFVFTLLLISLSLQADTSITYQGQLQDGNGPYTGVVDMTFRFYDSLADGDQVGSEIFEEAVPVTSGLFQVELDFGAVYDQPLWLEIEVDGAVLSPRQPITPVPVAIHALNSPDGGESGSWQLGGNAGTDPDVDFIGTTDHAPVVIRADGERVLWLQPGTSPEPGWDVAGNFLAGHPGNTMIGDVAGATISGGGGVIDGDAGYRNAVSGNFGVVSGGAGNSAFEQAAAVGGGFLNEAVGVSSRVGGGNFNVASGPLSTVAGGGANTASGVASAIGGGLRNCAGARYSWAGGRRAKVRPDSNSGDSGTGCEGIEPTGGESHLGTFIWADSTDADFESTGSDQFLIRAGGGVGVNTNSPEHTLDVDGSLRVRSAGHAIFEGDVFVESLGGSSATEEICRDPADGKLGPCGSSSRRYKHGIEDYRLTLEQVRSLRPVSYRLIENGQSDIGLMAEDLARMDERLVVFDQEGRPESIRYGRLSVVVIAALHELDARTKEQVARLRSENAELRELAQRNAELEKRLATLESLVLEERAFAGDP